MSSFNLFNDFKEFLAKHNDLEEFKSIMSLIESSLDLYKADPDNFIENISKRKFRKNEENNLQSVSTILNDTSTDTTENYFYTLKLKLKSKRLNSTNQDSNNQPVSSIEPERNLQEISNKGINSSLLNRAKFCDNKNLSKTLRRYILKDMSLVEEIWDNFETDDEYLIYNKSCMKKHFSNVKFFFIKHYFSNMVKKYYYECSRRKNQCPVKILFVRQNGMSLCLVSNKSHNH